MGILVVVNNDIIQVIVGDEVAESSDVTYGFRDVWEKVKAAAKKLGDDIRGRVETAIEELKPQILDSLNKVKQIVIDAGKKVLIQVKGEIVRIITEVSIGDSGESAAYGFGDIWAKVKAAAKKAGDKIKVDVVKVIEEFKPKVLADLKKFGETIIEGGKKIIVTIKNDVVEVIVGEFVASSEDETYMAKRGFRDVWEKVKAAAKKLGDDIRGRVETAIEELKPQILDSLNKVKQIVIDAGKKILIQVKGEIVRIITDISIGDSGDAAQYGFSDIWAKVKAAAVKVSAKVKVDVLKVLEEYKPM